jgi:hypothetical protein
MDFPLETRLRLAKRVSFSIKNFRGAVDTVEVNSDDESKSYLDKDISTTKMSK